MQQIQDFLQHHWIWILPLLIILAVGQFGWHYRNHKRRRIVFPQLPPEKIRFHEIGASGYSHKSTFTRFGGASRCLQITVTDAEVWIRIGFPFNILAWQVDLEHRISKTLIVSVQPTRSRFASSLLLDYRDEQGGMHRLTLLLQKPDDFLKALS